MNPFDSNRFQFRQVLKQLQKKPYNVCDLSNPHLILGSINKIVAKTTGATQMKFKTIKARLPESLKEKIEFGLDAVSLIQILEVFQISNFICLSEPDASVNKTAVQNTEKDRVYGVYYKTLYEKKIFLFFDLPLPLRKVMSEENATQAIVLAEQQFRSDLMHIDEPKITLSGNNRNSFLCAFHTFS